MNNLKTNLSADGSAAMEVLWRAVDKADRNMWADTEDLRNAVGVVHGILSAPAAQGFDAEFWKKAWVEERARSYRKEGMAIEQARIHAETDAARIAALAAQQGGAK